MNGFLQHTSFRNWLRISFVGPVTVALAFAGGLNSLVIAIANPLKALVIDFVGGIIRQSRLDFIPLHATASLEITIHTTFLAFGLMAVGMILGMWLYPKS